MPNSVLGCESVVNFTSVAIANEESSNPTNETFEALEALTYVQLQVNGQPAHRYSRRKQLDARPHGLTARARARKASAFFFCCVVDDELRQ